jgi:hypothetical protein
MTMGASEGSAAPAVPPVYFRAQSFETAAAVVVVAAAAALVADLAAVTA